MSARILDIDPETYHRDPCVTPSLSSSIAKLIVDKSPLHAWSAHPRLGGKTRESTKAMEVGRLGHRLLLGKGADIAEIPFVDYRKDAAKSARDRAESEGKIPVLTHALVAAREMATAHATRLKSDHGIVLRGESEVAIEWSEELFMSDARVACRAMMDHLLVNDGVIYDVKIVASAHPDVVSKNIVSYGYDIQHAAYTSALQHLRPEHAGRVDFVFLFLESEEPFAVQPYRLDGSFREHGQRRWDRAKRIWRECLLSGKWPGYAGEIVNVAPPQWAMAREMETATYGE